MVTPAFDQEIGKGVGGRVFVAPDDFPALQRGHIALR